MNRDLAFLSRLFRELSDRPSPAQLRATFTEILAAAADPQNAEATAFFCCWMERVAAATRNGAAADAADAIRQIRGHTTAAGPSATPALRASDLRLALLRPRMLQILVTWEGQPLGTATLGGTGRSQTVRGARPGWYCLSLDTGWVLWEGRLEREVLISAEQGRADATMRLAAADGQQADRPSLDLALAEWSLHCRVFPGLESGTLVFARL